MIEYTYKEVGALMVAMGCLMHQANLCTEAMQDGYSNDFLVNIMVTQFQIDEERARQIVHVPLAELIDSDTYSLVTSLVGF